MEICNGDTLLTFPHGEVKVTDIAELDDLVIVTKDVSLPAEKAALIVINRFQVLMNVSRPESSLN